MSVALVINKSHAITTLVSVLMGVAIVTKWKGERCVLSTTSGPLTLVAGLYSSYKALL